MLLNSHFKKGFSCLLLAFSLVFGIPQLIIAKDNRQDIAHQLADALANQPRSDTAKRLASNVDKLRLALGGVEPTGDDQNLKTDIADAVDIFQDALTSSEEETAVLLNQWEIYLKSASHYSNSDYFKAIKSQQLDYMNAISALGGLMEHEKKMRKNHTPSWIDDLIKRFGIDCLSEKRDAIFQNLSYIAATSSRQYKVALKDLFYIEAMLYGSYREYFGKFLKFYNTKTDDAGRIKLRSRKEVAEALLEVIDDASIAAILNQNVLKERLAANSARELDEELFSFFNELSLTHNINTFKAMEDIQKASSGH